VEYLCGPFSVFAADDHWIESLCRSKNYVRLWRPCVQGHLIWCYMGLYGHIDFSMMISTTPRDPRDVHCLICIEYGLIVIFNINYFKQVSIQATDGLKGSTWLMFMDVFQRVHIETTIKKHPLDDFSGLRISILADEYPIKVCKLGWRETKSKDTFRQSEGRTVVSSQFSNFPSDQSMEGPREANCTCGQTDARGGRWVLLPNFLAFNRCWWPMGKNGDSTNKNGGYNGEI